MLSLSCMPYAYLSFWTLRVVAGRTHGTCEIVQQGVLMFLVCSVLLDLDTEEQLRGRWQSVCGYVQLVC